MSENMDRPDNRYVAELPSGIIKNPRMCVAGVDLFVNDVVWEDKGTVYPMFDESREMYGVVAARMSKGKTGLIAT